MSNSGWVTTAIKTEIASWHYRVMAGIALLIAFLLSRQPLFGVLGFEFAFAMAVVGSVLGALLGSKMVYLARHAKVSAVAKHTSPHAVIAGLWLTSALASAALLLPGALLISINAIWIRNCDWFFGIKCFMWMSLLSTVIASGYGVLIGLCIPKRKWLHWALPPLLLLASVLWSLLHFYQSPAVFSYNPFAGYFPGNLYDENIDLRAPFYWARSFHLALLVALAALVALFLDVSPLRLRRHPRPSGMRLPAVFTLLIVGGCALFLHLHSGDLRFSVSAGDMQSAMPGRYESEHFTIIYPADQSIADSIETIAEEHEFRRAQLVRDFDIDPPGKITSYYFANPDQKHELMGARNVYMAKPWRNEIYVHHEAFPHQVLRHEIAHVFAGYFGDSIFKVSAGTFLSIPVFFNVGMIEGIAVAADWPDHFNKALTPHQSVKAMQVLKMMPPVQRLFSTGFMAFSAARGYTVAGSYLRFLLDRYGIDALKDLYRSGGDFLSSYGRSQATLTREWHQVITETDLPERAEEVIKERFRRTAIFKRPCPHAIARAQEDMFYELSRGDSGKAISIAREVCDHVPKEPRYQLQLAGLLVHAKKTQEASEIYQRIGFDKENITSSLRARALFKLLAIRHSEGKPDEAKALLETILAMPLPDAQARQAQVMYQLLSHTGPAGPPLREIFWSEDPARSVDRIVVVGLAAEAIAAEPSLGLAHYLLGRQLSGRGNPGATCRSLRRALSSSLSPLVEREAARLLAQAAYLAGRYDDLQVATTILVRADQPEVTRLSGYDWRERGVWKQTGTLPPAPLGWANGKTQHAP